jgi:Leucine-rich repeat (LRR) protein
MKTASFGLDDSSKAVVEKGIAALRHDRLKEQNSQLVASSTLRHALQASTQSLKVFRWEMERAQASVSSHNQLKNALEGLERQIESLNSSGKKAPELETLSERAKSLRSAIEAFDKRDKDADALHLIQKDLQLFETTIGAYTDVGNVQPKGELQDYSTRDIWTFLDDPLWRKYFWKEVGSDASEAELAPIRTQVQRLANAWNRLEEQHSQWVKEKKLASSKARLSAQLAPFKRGLEDWCKAEPNDLSRREAQKRIIEALDAIKSSDSDANELTLDLNDIGLTEVPPNLNQLPSLYHLNLSGNQITHVPADLACAELNLSRQTSDEIRLSISEVQATALSAVDLRGCANVRFEDIDGAKAKPNNSLCRIGVDKGAHNLSDDDLKTLRSAQISVIELSA